MRAVLSTLVLLSAGALLRLDDVRDYRLRSNTKRQQFLVGYFWNECVPSLRVPLGLGGVLFPFLSQTSLP